LAARATAASATSTAETLSTCAVPDAGAVLNALEPVATDIAARHDALDQRAVQAATRELELTAAITAADSAGEGQDALAQATRSARRHHRPHRADHSPHGSPPRRRHRERTRRRSGPAHIRP
jgi:hypothetical protein